MMTFVDDEFPDHCNAGFMPTWVRTVFVSAPRDLQNGTHPQSRLFGTSGQWQNAREYKLREL
jgi:hypothetical protein